ncbi:MAG TPA: methyltransferase domain-containing protein [Thermoleophilaceae bacterium]|nr:methyltransferase domain-containing protein [Thermoleophilaceae bacterium]
MTTETPNPTQAYQSYFGPAIFEPLTERVLAVAAPAIGERVIDVACGTGILTRRAAVHAAPRGRVVGVDINPAMIETARSIRPEEGSAPIEYREGDGTALDEPSGAYDVAYCQQGLQFFPDRAAGARELRRVVRDGGRAVVAVWQGIDRHPLYAALADAEEPHLAALGVSLSREELIAPFSLGGTDQLRDLLTRVGFADVELATDSIQARFADADRFVERLEYAYAAVVPAFAQDPAAFQAYLERIAADTKDVVDEYRTGDEVVVPMHANIAVAR